jgi:hypothetical protein
MNDPEAVDLSMFDPARDPDRWSLLAESTRHRIAEAVRRRGEADVFAVLAGWGRPVLAAAAIVLLALGTAIASRAPHAASRASDARRLAFLTESSALEGRAPTGGEVLVALGLKGAR